jgi:hypothetical protein
MKKGKCLFAFSQPSLHHLLSLVGRWIPHRSHVKSKIVRALATDSLKESVSLHLGKKREKIIKTPNSRSPIFNLLHWVSTVFPNT